MSLQFDKMCGFLSPGIGLKYIQSERSSIEDGELQIECQCAGAREHTFSVLMEACNCPYKYMWLQNILLLSFTLEDN